MINSHKWRTVRDAISDLPPPEGTEIRNLPAPLDLHFGRNPTELSRKRYRAIPDEGMNRFDLQKIAPELTPACWIRKKSGGTESIWGDSGGTNRRLQYVRSFSNPRKAAICTPNSIGPINAQGRPLDCRAFLTALNLSAQKSRLLSKSEMPYPLFLLHG